MSMDCTEDDIISVVEDAHVVQLEIDTIEAFLRSNPKGRRALLDWIRRGCSGASLLTLINKDREEHDYRKWLASSLAENGRRLD